MTAFESLRAEIAGLSDSLRGARIEEFNVNAAALENKLPALLRQARESNQEIGAETAALLRRDMLRMAALMESLAAYGRARLALEQPPGDAYGPNGSPAATLRRSRLQEA
jgi:hypothetical protein